jgi:hypothetical protein
VEKKSLPQGPIPSIRPEIGPPASEPYVKSRPNMGSATELTITSTMTNPAKNESKKSKIGSLATRVTQGSERRLRT